MDTLNRTFNNITAQQSLAANAVDSTGQFKWMIRVIPFLEFIIFGIIIFLGIPMGIVAGAMGAQKGGAMIVNYAFGLVAFSFIDVALAIVQSISMYYYGNKMTAVVAQLGSNPFTSVGMAEYLQNFQYMSGMMGLASVITVPLVVGIVFKGESMAALGALNSVQNKYSGDKGGASAKDALATQSAKHQFEAHEQEAYARGELQKFGIEAPKSASAVQTLDSIISEGEKYGQAGGALAAGSAMNNGSMSAYANSKVTAGTGHGMQSTAMDVGSGVALAGVINKDPSALGDFAFQSGTTAEGNFVSTANLGHASQEEGSEISRKDQVRAASALAGKAKADEVGAGLGLIEMTGMFDENGTLVNNGTTSESIKGAKITSAQKALSQIGLGSTGDIDKISAKAFEDGARSGQTMNEASDLMFSGKKDANGREIYDRDKAAKGAALKEIGSLQADAQTAIAADEKTTKEKNGDVDYIMGTGAQGRKAANDMIGVGEKFGAMSNKDQIDLMRQEKENAGVGFVGGIEATNAEIQKHNSGKDAIKDMITQAQKKGIESAADSQNLRTDYGDDLENSKKLISDKQKDSIVAENEKLKNQKSKIQSQSSFHDSDNKKIEEIDKKINTNNERLANNDSMTMTEQSQLISQSKIDSQLGQAVGIKNNVDNKSVGYAENAKYGEESKQQATKAKIDTMGGVENAVSADVAEASLKAVQQKMGTTGSLSEYLQSKAGGSHSSAEAASMAKAIMEGGQGAAEFMRQAISGAGALAFAQSMGKTRSGVDSLEKFDNAEQYAENEGKKASAIASKEKGKLLLDKDQNHADAFVNKLIDWSAGGDPKKREEAVQLAQKQGLLKKGKDGKLHAPTGTEFSDALAVMSAGDMGRDKQFQFMGKSFNIDRDAQGNTRFQGTSQETDSVGRKYDSGHEMKFYDNLGRAILGKDATGQQVKDFANITKSFTDVEDFATSKKGVLGAMNNGALGALKEYDKKFGTDFYGKTKDAMKDDNVGDFVANSFNDFGKLGAGVLALETGSRALGAKNGVVKPAFTKLADFVDPDGSARSKLSGNSSDNPPDNTSQSDKSQTNDSVNDKGSKQSTPPRNTNFAGQPTEHHPTNQSKGIVSKFSEMFKSPKMEKFSEIASRAFGKSHDARGFMLAAGTTAAAGYALFGGTDASASEFPIPKVNSAQALEGAKRDMMLQKAPLAKSGTVLDNTLEDASQHTGYAALGMSALGLISKTAARVAPIAGDVYAAVDTANRANKGDYIGAAMSATIGAASNIPVVGTAAALAVAGTQAVTDYMGITGGNGNTPSISPAAATALSIPSGGGLTAPTIVQQNTDNHANAQAMAQAITAQGPSYGPTATEATNTRIADIMQDQKNSAFAFNKKMEINSNAAYTKDTMNHKELLEHQSLTAGLNPDNAA